MFNRHGFRGGGREGQSLHPPKFSRFFPNYITNEGILKLKTTSLKENEVRDLCFTATNGLSLHIAKVHPSTVLMSCDTCGKGFHSRGNLEKHVQSDHGPKEILKEDESQPMDIDFDESIRLSKLQDEKVILR